MVRRSVLFSPGDQPELQRKAPGTGADVVVFDLEDAVAPQKKAEARKAVATVLSEIEPDCEVCVRINPPGDGGEDDLREVIDGPALDSIMLPKVDSAEAITELDAALDAFGADLPILAILETAGGILHAEEIATADATDAVLMGAEDLSADLGATRTAEGTEIMYARQKVVTAAAYANIDAIDTLYTDFQDSEGLATDTEFCITLGYEGKMAIHPNQVSIINDAFTPEPDELEWAKQVIEARDAAEEEGRGVFEVEGEMIDAPLITQAETILERARQSGLLE